MTACDHGDDGPCVIKPVYFKPPGTDLTLCERHANLWRRSNGMEVVETTRPRRANGEVIPGGDRERLR